MKLIFIKHFKTNIKIHISLEFREFKGLFMLFCLKFLHKYTYRTFESKFNIAFLCQNIIFDLLWSDFHFNNRCVDYFQTFTFPFKRLYIQIIFKTCSTWHLKENIREAWWLAKLFVSAIYKPCKMSREMKNMIYYVCKSRFSKYLSKMGRIVWRLIRHKTILEQDNMIFYKILLCISNKVIFT